ncbi:MAG: hypothetical protein ABDH21_06985 [bacterium]
MAADNQQRVYIVGYNDQAGKGKEDLGTDNLVVIRLNPDGSLDSSLGAQGIVILNSIDKKLKWVRSGGCDIFPCDDSFFIVGTANELSEKTSIYELVVLKMDPNGNPDTSFGQGGYFVLDNSYPDIANSIYVYNSRVYVSGEIYPKPSSSDALVLSLDYSGNLIDSVKFGKADKNDKGSSIFVDLQNRIYMSGFSGGELLVSRFIDSGSSLDFDNSFDGDGIATFDGLAGSVGREEATRIMTDNSNQIYVCGYCEKSKGVENMIVLRLRQDGSIDTSFAQEGVFVPFGYQAGNINGRATGLAINSNGEIFVAGNAVPLKSQEQFVVLFKLNSQGQLDNSFGNNGYLILDSIAGAKDEDIVNHMIIDRFGRMFITGASMGYSGLDLFVVRIE